MSSDAFLELEVQSSSPARLRLLLIQRAVGLCERVKMLWDNGKSAEAMQWLLSISDILIELLDGVTDPNNPAARPVSDLYVFNLRLIEQAIQTQSLDALQALQEILQIDLETWTLFLQNEKTAHGNASSLPMNDQEELNVTSSLDIQM